jgi:hypothetical protein
MTLPLIDTGGVTPSEGSEACTGEPGPAGWMCDPIRLLWSMNRAFICSRSK